MSSTTAAEGGRSLHGQVALVTGASRGIGLACARAMHAEGARVLLLGRDTEALTTAVRALGPRADCHAVDLAVPEEVERVVAGIREQIGGAPDIVVNNAAEFFVMTADATPLTDFERAIRVNLTSHFQIVRAFLSDMKRRADGHIVTIGSIADERGLHGNAAYSASKFGLRGLHEVLREELRGTGVRTTLVSPARVDTTIWQSPGAGAARPPSPAGMIPAQAVADAVRYAVTRPADVNIDELRLSRS